MQTMWCVYVIRNEVNGKVYVGESGDLIRRWKAHLRDAARGVDLLLYRAMRKHGIERFHIHVLSEHGTESEAFAEEVRVVALLRSNKARHGYNSTAGGDGAASLTPEARARQREACRAFTREHIMTAVAASVSARRGVARPREVRERIAEKLRGQRTGTKMSQQARKNMSDAAKRRWAKLDTQQRREATAALRR